MSDDGKTINKDNVEELELVAKQDGAGEEERPMENLDDILNPVSKRVTGAVDGVVEAGKSMGEPDEELNKLTDEAKQLKKRVIKKCSKLLKIISAMISFNFKLIGSKIWG
ncbi:hypothetical protein KKA13_00075 [Patescibacteria group bacterium]|nr:hypothetical protein [Patescibacteria group bacterium]